LSKAATVQLPPPANGRVDLLIIAGEHSGDQHAAKLVRRLRDSQPALEIAALGGPEIAAAGAQLLFDLTHSSVVGFVEVVRNLSFFTRLMDQTVTWIRQYQPRAVCFVDYPGFNLRLAKMLFEKKISQRGGGAVKTIFYISPQIWAWKGGRRFTMAKHLDALAVIFPFEIQSYADTSLPVAFVGHPFVADDYRSPVAYDPAGPVLLLPGSRKQAVSRIFPVMLAGYRAFHERPAIVLYPSETVAQVLRAARPAEGVELRPMPREEGVAEPIRASAVLTSSGTMSMHCALAGIPGTIVYRAHLFTYLIGRRLVKVPFIGIANLLLNKPMYPEYIQGAATPGALANELRECIQNPDRQARTRADATELRSILRQPTEADAAAWLAKQLKK
jgi:lipid-A-disaccharide synthase